MKISYIFRTRWFDFLSDAFIFFVCITIFTHMTLTVLQYSTLETDIAFLKIKQQYVHSRFWMLSFYLHVFTAILSLCLGLFQFSAGILKDWPKVHRWIGRIYVADILIINVPTGMVLAVTASGYLKISFIALDLLWFWFTYRGFTLAKQHKFIAHKNYMFRSYALTFSAITLRLGNMVFAKYLHFDPMIVYSIFSVMGWLPNLLFVEWLIRKNRKARHHSKNLLSPTV